MTTERNLDFRLAAWLDERATSTVPDDLLARSLDRVATVRQRPALLTRDAYEGPWLGVGRTPLAAPLLLILLALLVAVVVAVGSQLLRPLVSVIIPPAPSAPATSGPTLEPLPSETPTPAGPLGGGLILAHSFARYGDPGPFDVVAIDAGTGETTLLGKLPGEAVTGNSGPYTFEQSADRTRVIVFDQSLQEPTAAAASFGFAAAVDLGRECCPNEPMEWTELSPEGNRVAAVHADGFDNPIEIVVVDLAGHMLNRLPVPAAMNGVGPLAWAPDGTALLMPGCRPCNKAETPTQKQTAHHDHLYLIPVDGSPWQELLDLNNGGLAAQWSPDGLRLAVGSYPCAKGSFMPRCDPMGAPASLSVLTLADGIQTQLTQSLGITGTDWSPDGSRIAYGDAQGAFVVDAATGAKTKVADGQSFGADWSPDGTWLIVDQSRSEALAYQIWIVRPDGSQLHQLLAGYAGATW
jgi:dipeptidyl aminopeptidase/acylaminoacyl peptidase